MIGRIAWKSCQILVVVRMQNDSRATVRIFDDTLGSMKHCRSGGAQTTLLPHEMRHRIAIDGVDVFGENVTRDRNGWFDARVGHIRHEKPVIPQVQESPVVGRIG